MTVSDAFGRFRSRLEITPTEERNASARQQAIRRLLDASFAIDRDFLTGSYIRETKTKPLHDVDIMCVLSDRSPLKDHPRQLLDTVASALSPVYGKDRVTPDRHAVRVDFGLTVVDDVSGDDVMSFEVVPAFAAAGHYLIPDDALGEWIATNPDDHKQRATDANTACGGHWKPLVKMAKKWNDHSGQPVAPSFLIEVMALDLVIADWSGSYPLELRQFFASSADRIGDEWHDPAGVGPDINDSLLRDSAALEAARRALQEAERQCTEALRLDRAGRTTDALTAWQKLLGPLFPKS